MAEVVSSVRWVVFDVGETLVDETRSWTRLAHEVGITPFSLMGVLGALIERGEDHRQVWRVLGVSDRIAVPAIQDGDLYPDALACVRAVRAGGLGLGFAGNQPAAAHEQVQALGLEPDFIASSARWGVEKPSPEFFSRIVDACDARAGEILYVGDRLDNDILPARAAGLRTAFIRRGPWGYIHAERPEAAVADIRLDSLDELTRMLAERPRVREVT